MDRTLFYAINHGIKNPFLDWLMPIVTSHNSWIPIGIILTTYLVCKNPKRGVLVFLLIVAAVIIGDMVNHRILKEIFARIRPCRELPDVYLLTGCGHSFSFPSSHSVNSFTLALLIGLFERKLLIIAILAASLVAFSRVYLGVHYPSDVIAGALAGIGIGYAAYWISSPGIIRLTGVTGKKRVN